MAGFANKTLHGMHPDEGRKDGMKVHMMRSLASTVAIFVVTTVAVGENHALEDGTDSTGKDRRMNVMVDVTPSIGLARLIVTEATVVPFRITNPKP